MPILAPPPKPPPVALADGDGLRRVQYQLRLWGLTIATVLITAWFCTLGIVPAILALTTAKHVLVAILAMGLGVDSREPAEQPCIIPEQTL